MNFNLIKQADGSFLPAYPTDHDKAKRFKVGEECNFSHKKIRSVQFHRRYFAMIKMVFDNQDIFDDQETFRKYVEMKAGHYTVTKTVDGEMILPKSIAFDKLDDDEFQDLYGNVVAVVWEKFGMNSKVIEEELINFM